MISVQTHVARKNLANLIEEAFYKNERVQILRNKRPMAWLIGDNYMKAIEKMVDMVAERDPDLARDMADELRQVMGE